MKKINIGLAFLFAVIFMLGCEKQDKYPGGVVSSYIPVLDVKELYKGNDLTLSVENMGGSDKITGVVISDHSGNNLPSGLLVIQDKRRLNQLRGISIALGADASKYIPGDSVVVSVVGGVLKRVNNILQITNIPNTAITKVKSGVEIAPNRVNINLILADPYKYESTLVAVVKGGFDPVPKPTDVFSGDKIVNDAFGNLTLHTESNATFANTSLPALANFYGIVFPVKSSTGEVIPQHRLRTASDIVPLASSPIPSMLISGWIADPQGTDANNEYVQFLATRDIDFSVTPFSMVTTNNAGASTPIGNPVNGWATGGLRTYKINITSGTATKGTYFYVGGTNKLINSTSSTSISNANWVKTYKYDTSDGEGFGTKTTNLLANSGNAYGIAIFEGTAVTKESIPVDVVFVHTGGSLYDEASQVGYRIGNTDYYDIVNPVTLVPQPFFRAGTNGLAFKYTTPSDVGYFYKMGGVYSVTLGRWLTVRSQTNFMLTKTSQLSEIEGLENAIELK